MSSQYEIVFIMTPVLSEQQRKDAVKSYTKTIKGGGCEIVHEGSWGLKKLAYPIQKKSTGYYHCVEFKGSGEIIPTLELALKRDEKILRSLTVKLDKHAIAFNIKDREKAKAKREAPAEEKPKEEAETPKTSKDTKKEDVKAKESNAEKSKEEIVSKESKKDEEVVAKEDTKEEIPEETKVEDSESKEPKKEEEIINS